MKDVSLIKSIPSWMWIVITVLTVAATLLWIYESLSPFPLALIYMFAIGASVALLASTK